MSIGRRPAGDAPPAPPPATAPTWSCSATSAARWPTSRSSRCCSSTRCASSSTGARLHLRRRDPRGHRLFTPGRRPGAGDGRPGRRGRARAPVGPHQLRSRLRPLRRAVRRRARPRAVAARPRRRALQLRATSRCRCSTTWSARRPARWWLNPEHPATGTPATPRASDVRRGRADGRVPQPDPARGVRARPGLATHGGHLVTWKTWLSVTRPLRKPCWWSASTWARTDGSFDASTDSAPRT